MTIHLGRPLPDASRNQPGRRPEIAVVERCPTVRPYSVLLPGGVYHASPVAGAAVRSYRTVSPLPDGNRRTRDAPGGLFSVALSLGSPPPGVTRHRISVEPGLSSPTAVAMRGGSGHPALSCAADSAIGGPQVQARFRSTQPFDHRWGEWGCRMGHGTSLCTPDPSPENRRFPRCRLALKK